MILLIDLLLTILVELLIAFFFKVRRWDDLLLIVAMNMITNPAVHVIQWIFRTINPSYPLLWVATVLAEILVVILEAKYLRKELGREEDAAKMSICMNAVSFLAGLPTMKLFLMITYA